MNRSFGAGGGGGKESRRTVVEVSPAGGGYGIGSSVHEVGTGPPVDMDIDETGCDVRTGRIDGLRTARDAFGHGGDFGYLTRDDFDIRVIEQGIGQDGRRADDGNFRILRLKESHGGRRWIGHYRSSSHR